MTNMRNFAALLDDNVTTASVQFEATPSKSYTFKILRTLAEDLVPGDIVLVDTIRGIKMAEVIIIHEEPEIDPDSDITFKWAFAKVDLGVLEDLHKNEKAIIKKLQVHQRKRLKENVLRSMGIDDIKTIGLD